MLPLPRKFVYIKLKIIEMCSSLVLSCMPTSDELSCIFGHKLKSPTTRSYYAVVLDWFHFKFGCNICTWEWNTDNGARTRSWFRVLSSLP
jgi:hypothetical protein